MSDNETADTMESEDNSNASSKKTSRVRRPNYDRFEVQVLVSEVHANKSVLFLSQNDSATNEMKNRIWSNIAVEVNKVAHNHRTPAELRKKWINYKSEMKDKVCSSMCTQKHEIHWKGGERFPGPNDGLYTKNELKALECIDASATQDDDEVDSMPVSPEDRKPVIADDMAIVAVPLIWNSQEPHSEPSANSQSSSNHISTSTSSQPRWKPSLHHRVVSTSSSWARRPQPSSSFSHQPRKKVKHARTANSKPSSDLSKETYRRKMLEFERQRLEIERERLNVEKQRLAIEKERLEYEKQRVERD